MSLHFLFIGTPDFSVPTLRLLFSEFQNDKLSVISMPDKVRGRGSSTTPSPVKLLAQEHGLKIYTPETKNELTEQIFKINPDIIIVVAYGMIIEKKVTDHFFCVNIHSSLLPKYRGASPIHTALLNGDRTTGITLIRMNEHMDEGDILYQIAINIEPKDNLGSLTQKLSDIGAKAMIDFLHNNFIPKNIEATPQNHDEASYAKKITKEELLIELGTGHNIIHNKIRAYSPKPGAYTLLNNRRVKLLSSEIINGKLKILKVQPEGKAPMDYSDFLLGYPEGIIL